MCGAASVGARCYVMTAPTAEIVTEHTCGRCQMTADLCLSLRDDCCVGCTHYPEVPDTDVDEVAERACAGDVTVSLNRQEYAEAHRRLHAAGLSISQIATRLGTTQRTVDRWNQGYTRPISRRPGGRAMSTTDELLSSAARNPAKRIQNAAQKAQEAIQRVRDLIAEDAGKAEARERVERLKRELAEAQAALRGTTVRTGSVTAIDSKAVRAWAKDNGVECPPVGRVPSGIVEAYQAAHTKAS
jgi:predicted transcriptional regulator